ncbi:MAG: oligosaccharide flippase family protein, partial [Bacteroides sp.]|nr:oligosaccharide flippase family protein [Bacteroides sp.]
MSGSKAETASRNIAWGIIERIVYSFGPFVIRTLMIHYLGSEYLGLNGLYTSILQVLSLAELGVGSAINYSMYKPMAEGDNDTVCALLALYRKLYTIIGLVILAAGLVLLPFLPNLISGSYPDDINLYTLYLIYLANTVVGYLLFIYSESIILAKQRVDVRSKIMSIINTLMYCIQAFLIVRYQNYYLYAIVIPVFTVIANIVKYVYTRRNFPEFVCRGKLPKSESKEIFKRVFALMMSKIGVTCRNSFDNIILSAFLGLVIVAKYQNYYYIISLLVGFISILNSAVVPTIGNSIVTESKGKVYDDFKKISFGYNMIISWWTCCLLVLYQPFIELWAGEEYLFPFGMVIIFCIYFYATETCNLIDLYKSASGIWWEDRFRPIIESVVNLALNICVVKYFGVEGVLISTIVCVIVINLPWSTSVLFKNLFQCSRREYIMSLMPNICLTTFICILMYYICSFSLNSLVLGFLVKGILCVIIPPLILLGFY